MRESVTGSPRVLTAEVSFSLVQKARGNKGRASLVSAAAVIPTPRVVRVFTGLKASVAGLVSSLLNPMFQASGCREYC